MPDDVKDVLLDQFDLFAGKLGTKGAAALAAWAASKGRSPTADAIVTMATKGGAPSAASIVGLLGAQAATIDIELMKQALNALGKPYNQLTTPGRDRPKIPITEGIELVLARLRNVGPVSKYDESTRKRMFEVSKRHS